uniref:Protein root UVB sensitive/RUS domain-containing protein n=1 Tax=Opuntia streptacantha TaxID=393608 RepID=A0A7C9E456_OPUST
MLFDDDPKQWRMYADFIGSAGSIFDLTTQLYPAYFLPLASLGNLSKAVARGLKDPSFRVIQNHFAASGNLGDVAAKEEVWEVTAQLIGLALGILILDTPGLVTSYPALLATWTSMRVFHLWLRFQSLSVLKFETVTEMFKLYTREKYVLAVDQWQKRDFEVLVAFKEGATSMSALRSMWQAYWLYENWDSSVDFIKALEESLLILEARFNDFVELLEEAGWNTCQINLNVPKEPYIEELHV